MMGIIKVNNLTKKYDSVTAVNHISFEVEKGILLGFLGVNGAGKTTVINMLATLLVPDEGSVEVCGEILGKRNQEIRRKIGIVYQQNCLDDSLSVQENLLCRGIIHGASKTEAKKQCMRLGKILKLDSIMKNKYRMLSGGQKRKVEIAAALMHTPELLFLDEPTTGLDPATRLDVWNTIERLQKDEKMTVFLTTHYMEEAAGADNIIIMDSGNIITSGTPFELKEKFATDRLKLYCRDEKDKAVVWEKLIKGTNKQHGQMNMTDRAVIEIPVRSTLDVIPLIDSLKDIISGFEVIQGNMDDVFLNAVGKKLAGEGEK